jgi:hypothetical protein
VFTGRPVEAAAALADDLTVGRPGDDADYETWRARIRAATTAIGAVA